METLGGHSPPKFLLGLPVATWEHLETDSDSPPPSLVMESRLSPRSSTPSSEGEAGAGVDYYDDDGHMDTDVAPIEPSNIENGTQMRQYLNDQYVLTDPPLINDYRHMGVSYIRVSRPEMCKRTGKMYPSEIVDSLLRAAHPTGRFRDNDFLIALAAFYEDDVGAAE
jgi:hypothetical protein